MVRKITGLCVFFMLSLSSPIMSQYIALQKDDRIEVRDIKGNYVSSGYFSDLKDIAQGEDIIVLWYESSKIEIRDFDLKYVASQYFSNLQEISTSQDWVVLHYDNSKVEVRDKDLKYFSSWYQ
jgi:hypothetical protein